jgi:HemY protein
MARIEGEQYGDAGRVREWLSRAASAPRDPAWTADGVVSSRWSPVSPATGELDAMRWRVPAGYGGGSSAAEDLAARLEVLAGVSARRDARAEAATPAAVVEPAPPAAAEVVPPAVQVSPPAPAQAPPRLGPPQAEDITPTDVPFRRDAEQTARPRPRKALETKIFVAPRAPDDPGSGPTDLDDLQGYPTKA